MEEGYGAHHFLTWCAVESLLQIVAVVIPLEFAGVSIEGSRSVLSVMLDTMVIALTVDLFASINSNIITCKLLMSLHSYPTWHFCAA
jgi:hypothetical protein